MNIARLCSHRPRRAGPWRAGRPPADFSRETSVFRPPQLERLRAPWSKPGRDALPVQVPVENALAPQGGRQCAGGEERPERHVVTTAPQEGRDQTVAAYEARGEAR